MTAIDPADSPGVERTQPRAEHATDASSGVGVVRVPPLRTCVINGQIVCPDDLCRNSSTTLCGLEEGIDFGSYWDEDDDYPDDGDRWCQECGAVEYECHCERPVFP